ncbi:NAD kinase [Gulosibacter sp. ACHW.36C]|jgi:NAD+ kinase|uniref:NAD kinase n=1 Tax=Gulosibacter sediminis TaxID=1729695 RepID=A0ABY4MYF3_9MICO|nr:NAD kinase [Gulosibacter sediminis]UQN14023.1 NAD kinase [Gulosibacter sediminis]
MSSEVRRILVVGHVARDEAIDATLDTLRFLAAHDIVPVLEEAFARELTEHQREDLPAEVERLGIDCEVADCELVVVLGGDGTILLGVDLAREANVPVLGVNLGHVGFLAESERESLPLVLQRAIDRGYEVEERMALRVDVRQPDGTVETGWALNEASIEKGNRQRMLSVGIDVDGEPLSSFGCDGVLFSTPTGSTAYSFSAGGPIVWPAVEALLLVPVSAHALFTKPIVVAPDSELAVEIHPEGPDAIIWLDGRRRLDLPAGSRVTGTRSEQPVRLARLHPGPFTTRLVKKFQLPTVGWRG